MKAVMELSAFFCYGQVVLNGCLCHRFLAGSYLNYVLFIFHLFSIIFTSSKGPKRKNVL